MGATGDVGLGTLTAASTMKDGANGLREQAFDCLFPHNNSARPVSH
jgi:hypothetical protein